MCGPNTGSVEILQELLNWPTRMFLLRDRRFPCILPLKLLRVITRMIQVQCGGVAGRNHEWDFACLVGTILYKT